MPKPDNVQKLVDPTNIAYAVCNCPKCTQLGVLDEEQYHGKVSILCECGYHETHDLSKGNA